MIILAGRALAHSVERTITAAARIVPRRCLTRGISSHLLFHLLWALPYVFPPALLGLGFRIPNQDAEAIARGNAFVATANNPSAVYYNPAGITQLPGHQFQFGLHSLQINSEYRSPTGATAKTLTEIQHDPQVYYTCTRGTYPLSFGLGVYAPYGLKLEWPEDSGFRSIAIEGRLRYLTVNPVVAWRINDRLSLGAGPTLNYADIEFRQGIVGAHDELNFQGDDTQVGFNLGLLWHPHKQWSLGVNYRHSNTMDFRGHSEARPFTPREGARGRMPFGRFVMGGIAYRPTPKWNIEFNVDWTDWDTMNTFTIDREINPDLGFPLNWESSFLYNLGISYYLDNGYWLGCGYFFSENSTSERNFSPLIPDTDLHVGSVGFGGTGKRWSWAVSGQLITGAPRRVRNSVSTSLIGETQNGDYQWFNQAINFSVGYRF